MTHKTVSQDDKNVTKPTTLKEDVNRQFLDRFTALVRERMATGDLQVDQLAKELCVSRSQLNRKISSLTGSSPAAYITTLCIERAKELFTTKPELHIDEVGYACGYSDPAYFSRVFRQIEGLSPTEFRKQLAHSDAPVDEHPA